MQEVENRNPPWLNPLLEATFFEPCQTHKNSRNSRCNLCCLQCTGNPFCVNCSNDHPKHQIIQIRRLSLSNGVRLHDIAKHINVGAIQPYKENSKQLIFLNSRPYKTVPYGVISTCDICHRSLPTANFKFCSLNCKRDAIYHGFPAETFALESRVSTCELHDSFEIDQLTTPRRQLKLTRLDILLAKSPIRPTSVARELIGNICPATRLTFNHMNSRKRKGIPQRDPLI